MVYPKTWYSAALGDVMEARELAWGHRAVSYAVPEGVGTRHYFTLTSSGRGDTSLPLTRAIAQCLLYALRTATIVCLSVSV